MSLASSGGRPARSIVGPLGRLVGLPVSGRRPHGPTSGVGRGLIASLGAALVASACAIPPEPIGTSDIQAMVTADLKRVYRPQEPLEGPLTLHEAMARVLKYNLDNRLKVMEEALSLRQVDVATISLLPRIAASAGYVARSNVSASSSQSITTGSQSLETSTSQDEERNVADLTMTWNILDFGVGYVAAKQQADRALIVKERRRKVVHNILQDTRLVYWRAVAAERLSRRIGPLLGRINGALRDSKTIGELRLASPLDALTYQRQLLRTRQQLLDLQRDLQVAKTQLATLMGQPPATDLKLEVPKRSDRKAPRIGLAPERIEEVALLRRPELVEEAYQARIGRMETTKAMLRMLPGIELNLGVNYDSNSYLLFNNWADYGAKVVWNLFNLLTGPANVALSESQEEFIRARREALAMAVLTQSRVSWLRYRQAEDSWKVASELEDIETRISGQIRDEVAAERRGALDAIQADFDQLIANLTADLAFAETQNAAGNILVTMGFDPLPEDLPGDDVRLVAAALAEREAAWFSGNLPSADAPAEAPAATPVAETPTAGPLSAAPETAAAAPVDLVPPRAAPHAELSAPPAAEGGAGPRRAHLGTYADDALALTTWDRLRRRLGGALPGSEAVLEHSVRKSDGKVFTLLRTPNFPDADLATRFCRTVEAETGESCKIVPTETAERPDATSAARRS